MARLEAIREVVQNSIGVEMICNVSTKRSNWFQTRFASSHCLKEIFMTKHFAFLVLMTVFWTSDASAMCIRDLGKSAGGYQQLTNTCGGYVNFWWRDQGYCSTGCLEMFGPQVGSRIHGVTGMRGHVVATECQGQGCTPPRR